MKSRARATMTSSSSRVGSPHRTMPAPAPPASCAASAATASAASRFRGPGGDHNAARRIGGGQRRRHPRERLRAASAGTGCWRSRAARPGASPRCTPAPRQPRLGRARPRRRRAPSPPGRRPGSGAPIPERAEQVPLVEHRVPGRLQVGVPRHPRGVGPAPARDVVADPAGARRWREPARRCADRRGNRWPDRSGARAGAAPGRSRTPAGPARADASISITADRCGLWRTTGAAADSTR